MVLSGSQQGIYLAACAFIDRVTSSLSRNLLFSAIHIFKAQGARVIGIPTDRDGMRTDLLSVLLKKIQAQAHIYDT